MALNNEESLKKYTKKVMPFVMVMKVSHHSLSLFFSLSQLKPLLIKYIYDRAWIVSMPRCSNSKLDILCTEYFMKMAINLCSHILRFFACIAWL